MKNRLPIIFIVATLLIDGIGIGLIFPVMPALIKELTGQSLGDAAIWGGVLATSYAVMQFIFGPIVGNLSDRFGRKPLLISALAVLSIDYFIMAVAPTIWLLFIGRVIAGLTAATPATAAAFMADISKPHERDKNFGLVHAAFGIGFAFGPMIGGILGGIDTRAPFYVAGVIAGANAIFGLLVLPESLPVEKRRPVSLARANPFAAFRAIGTLKGMGPLLIVFGLYQVALYVYPAIWAFFGLERFGFDEAMVGATMTLFGLTMAAAQAGLVGPAIAKFGAYKTALIAILVDTAAFVAFGLTSTVAVVWFLTVVTALSSIAMPALNGIMSRATPDTQQGELQGVISAISALATIVSPLLMTSVFAAFSQKDDGLYLPGAPFLISAALTLLCVFLLAKWRHGSGAKMS